MIPPAVLRRIAGRRSLLDRRSHRACGALAAGRIWPIAAQRLRGEASQKLIVGNPDRGAVHLMSALEQDRSIPTRLKPEYSSPRNPWPLPSGQRAAQERSGGITSSPFWRNQSRLLHV